MAMKIYTQKYAGMLPKIFEAKSVYLRAFGGNIQTLVGVEADEDFLVSTPDTYNVGDIVGLKIAKENIALRLKGDIQDYAL